MDQWIQNRFIQGGINSTETEFISIEPDAVAQYDWFAPNTASGLMQARFSRMDQSIEGFLLHLRSTNQRKEQYFGTKGGVGGGEKQNKPRAGF